MMRGVALALLLLPLGGCTAPGGPAGGTTTASTATTDLATPGQGQAPSAGLHSPDDDLAACPGFEAEEDAAASVRIGAGKAWDPTGNLTVVEMRAGESRAFAVEFTFVRAVPARAYGLSWSDGQGGRAPFTVTGPARLDVGEPCAPMRLTVTVAATAGDPGVPGYIQVRVGWGYGTDSTSVMLQRAWA
ncbi:MAG: hypothetical protein ABR586_07340 [Thermoplasmatota archaeon]